MERPTTNGLMVGSCWLAATFGLRVRRSIIVRESHYAIAGGEVREKGPPRCKRRRITNAELRASIMIGKTNCIERSDLVGQTGGICPWIQCGRGTIVNVNRETIFRRQPYALRRLCLTRIFPRSS